MKKNQKRCLFAAIGLLAAFALWTVLLRTVDVGAIGPCGSTVGLATLNHRFHGLTGVHLWLYVVTDWLGLVPIGVALSFAVLGLAQWIARGRLWRVDRDIRALGVFYAAVMAVYVLFELVVVNRRPVLLDGYLEASYPSSTTVLVLCVIPTAMLQARARIQSKGVRRFALLAMACFTLFMVVGRLLSGVHWLTDVVGGILLSAGLVLLYQAFAHPK